jgi:hypothetical protein
MATNWPVVNAAACAVVIALMAVVLKAAKSFVAK